jgi:hypothetical protein
MTNQGTINHRPNGSPITVGDTVKANRLIRELANEIKAKRSKESS